MEHERPLKDMMQILSGVAPCGSTAICNENILPTVQRKGNESLPWFCSD